MTFPEQDLDLLAKNVEERWTQYKQQVQDLKSWFTKFDGLLVEIDATSPKSDVLSSVEAHVQQIANAKESSRQSEETAAIAQNALNVEPVTLCHQSRSWMLCQKVEQAECASQQLLLSVEDTAREIVATKKAEILAMGDLGKNQNERSKKTLQTEASKLLTSVFLKAQNCLEDLERQLQCARQSTEEIQDRRQQMLSSLESAAVHSESANTIRENCMLDSVGHHFSWSVQL